MRPLKPGMETANQKFASLRTIHLKEPSSDPLHVQVKVRGRCLADGSATAVGPFFVLGAAQAVGDRPGSRSGAAPSFGLPGER